MAYTPKTWKDLPDETTPIKATDLNHIETGISNNSTDIGTKSELTTADKTNLVKAINELKSLLTTYNNNFASLFYKANDTFVIPTFQAIVPGGYITSAKTEIYFNIYTPKLMTNINTINITNLKLTVRQNSEYLLDGATVNVTTAKVSDNCIRCIYKSSSELTKATNNAPVGIVITGGTITFTNSENPTSDEENSDVETI